MKPDGFILGLSNGITCLATCAPVLIPYLMGEGRRIIPGYRLTGMFLFGRLLGYLLFATLSWEVGNTVLRDVGMRNVIIGAAYVLFSTLLIFYGFFKQKDSSCNSLRHHKQYRRLLDSCPALLPVAAGFATGLSFCPPFLLAVTRAAEQNSLSAAIYFFFTFFIGTSLLFLLAPFVGVLSRFTSLQNIGKMAAGLMGLYYLYSGIILFSGGLRTL